MSDHNKRRNKAHFDRFDTYIQKVQKQVHPSIGMNGETLRTVDAITKSLGNLLGDKASELARKSGKKTVSAREIQTAVRLFFPGELAKHSVTEGTKAVAKYSMHEGKEGDRVSNTSKAGLQFSVSRMALFLRGTSRSERVTKQALVYLAAVLEYIVVEILELAGNRALDHKKRRTRTTDIREGIRHDQELKELFYMSHIQIEGI